MASNENQIVVVVYMDKSNCRLQSIIILQISIATIKNSKLVIHITVYDKKVLK